jgi:hypothetical protein
VSDDAIAAVRAFLCADALEPPCPHEWDEYKDGYLQGYGDAVERLIAMLPQGFPHKPQTEAAETGTNRTDSVAERKAKVETKD